MIGEDAMEIQEPHKKESWTPEVQRDCANGRAVIRVPFVDLQEMIKIVPMHKIAPNLRIELSLESDSETAKLRRTICIFEPLKLQINNIDMWDGRQVQRFLQEEIEMDIPSKIASQILSFSMEIANELHYEEIKKDFREELVFSNYHTILEEATCWEENHVNPRRLDRMNDESSMHYL